MKDKLNLLITGSSGFIGKNYINSNNQLFNINTLSLRTVDLSAINFKETDTILHLAGLAHQMEGAPDEDYFRINAELTFNFAKKAKEAGVSHFVFISTAKVYGEFSKINQPFDEQSICQPHDAYAKSKLKGEELLQTLEDPNFKVAIVRIPLVYGSGAKGNLDRIMRLVQQSPLLPFDGINNSRSLIYTKNLFDILNKIISEEHQGIFIACDSKPLSTTTLVELIISAFNNKVFLLKTPSIVFKTIRFLKPSVIERLYGSFELNNENTLKRLNYSPKYTSKDGIIEMVNFFKQSKK